MHAHLNPMESQQTAPEEARETRAALSLGLFGPFRVRLHGRPLPRLRSRKGLTAALLPLVWPLNLHLAGYRIEMLSHRTIPGEMRIDGREFPPQGFRSEFTPGFVVHLDGMLTERVQPSTEWTWRYRGWYYWLTIRYPEAELLKEDAGDVKEDSMPPEQQSSEGVPACPACCSPRIADAVAVGDGSIDIRGVEINPWKFVLHYPALRLDRPVWLCIACGFLWSSFDLGIALHRIRRFGTEELKARTLEGDETLPRPASPPAPGATNLPVVDESDPRTDPAERSEDERPANEQAGLGRAAL